jgi:hypothetical protein
MSARRGWRGASSGEEDRVNEGPSASSMLGEEEQAFRAAVREFAEQTLRPRVAAMD